MRHLAKKFGAYISKTIFILLACFAILELVFRAYFYISQDFLGAGNIPAGLQLLPNSERVYGLRPMAGPPISSNTFGFRGEEITLDKGQNTFRIIMLGDSITFGNGVAWNETFSYHLQTMFNDSYRSLKFEVLNLGVSGYNTKQELAILRELGLKLDPDIVVLNVFLNDSDPVKKVGAYGLSNRTTISKLSDINVRIIVNSSYVLTFMRSTTIGLIKKYVRNPGAVLSVLNSPGIMINSRVKESAWEVMKTHMEEIYYLAQANEIALVVVIYPYMSQIVYPDVRREPQMDLLEFWRARGVPVLDTIPEYEVGGETMFQDAYVHLSPYGHQRIATAILRFLRDSNSLPQSSVKKKRRD